MKTNAVLISVLAGILVLSTCAMLAENSDASTKFESKAKALTSHNPNYINGNNNFTSENA